MSPGSASALATPPSGAEGPQRSGCVPVRDAFEALVAEGSAGTQQGTLSSLGERREAFERFERLLTPGGKPGRDWKYDYARIASELPWQKTSARRSPSTKHAASSADGDRLLRAQLGRAVRWRDDKFASLARAFATEPVVLYVPAGVRPDGPLEVRLEAGAAASTFPYVLVVLDAGAEATVVEEIAGDGFSCGIVEVIVGDGARLDYVALQRADTRSIVLMNRGAVCRKDATVRWYLAELGGALSRSVVTTRMEGRGASGEITGLFFNDGDQHVDLSTLVEHAVGDTTSRTTIKSAAKDRGQGRYLGNIRIAADANGSDAALRDDALLLSKAAHIDSVPALEIASNDVKAFHGATVGSIDEEELFYAQSRGIARDEAERMIALGFFEPIVAAFPLEPVRDYVRETLARKAPAAGTAVEVSS